MTVDFWMPWGQLAFVPPTAIEYVLVGIFALCGIGAAAQSWQGWTRPSWSRLGLFAGLLLVTPLASSLLAVRVGDAGRLPPPGVPANPPPAIGPLAGLVPITFGALLLGSVPAALLGLATGAARAAIVPTSVIDPFFYALFGLLVGRMVRRPYRDGLSRAVRHPIVAVPLGVILALPVQFISLFAPVWHSGFAGLDYAAQEVAASAVAMVFPAVAAGLAAEGALLAAPACQPRLRLDLAPHSRRLERGLVRRQLGIAIASTLVASLAFMLAAGRSALHTSEGQAADEAWRVARSAASGTTHFVQTGMALVSSLADSGETDWMDPQTVAGVLRRGYTAVPFFEQLLMIGADGLILAAYPPLAADAEPASSAERDTIDRALATGAVQVLAGHRLASGTAYASFVAPLPTSASANDGESVGLILGRARLDTSPALRPVLDCLETAAGLSEGFVVNGDGRVIVHGDPSLLVTVWKPEDYGFLETGDGGEWTSQVRSPRDGTRQLAHVVPVEGVPWSVVALVPFGTILSTAADVVAPQLVALLILGGLLAIAAVVTTRSVSRPLVALATEVERWVDGDLMHPVDTTAEGEIGRVARALERARVRLKTELNASTTLLDLERSAGATLDLRQGLGHILEGALTSSGAQVARAVVVGSDGSVETSVGRGEVRHGVRDLDRAILAQAQEYAAPFELGDLSAILSSPDEAGPGRGRLHAAFAAPVRRGDRLAAVLWTGYRADRHPGPGALDTLATLADQAAAVIANARSYRFSEDERRLLAAILDSSSEGFLVTDGTGSVVRCSRAAAAILGMDADRVVGSVPGGGRWPAGVASLLSMPLVEKQPAIAEVSMPDGRLCACSVFLVLDENGERLGRVMTLSDVTALRHLERARSGFIERIAQDMRRPLTLIHGHATMLARAGSLTTQQRSFVSSILQSVQLAGRLIQGLREIEREEQAAASHRAPVQLDVVVRSAVAAAESTARPEGAFLRTGTLDPDVIVFGEEAQLRRALDMLLQIAVDAALPGSAVSVDLGADETEATLSISVAQGGGISTADDGAPIASGPSSGQVEDPARLGPEMAAVKAIASAHGGDMEARALVDGGVSYELVLPRDRSSDTD